jgi:hypothetical protein
LELTTSGLFFSNYNGSGYFTIDGNNQLTWNGDPFSFMPK